MRTREEIEREIERLHVLQKNIREPEYRRLLAMALMGLEWATMPERRAAPSDVMDLVKDIR